VRRRSVQSQCHEQSRMPAESLVYKRLCRSSSFMRQELRLDTVNSRGLLQRLNYVREQPPFDLCAIGSIPAFAHEEVADHAFIIFVNKERITENFAAGNGGIAWQKLGVYIAENHLHGAGVVPAEHGRPHLNFIVQ